MMTTRPALTRSLFALAAAGTALALSAPAQAQAQNHDDHIRVVQQVVTHFDHQTAAEIGRQIRDAMRTAGDTITAWAGSLQDRNFTAEQTDKETKHLTLGPNAALELKNISGDIIVTGGSGREATIDIVRKSRGRTEADAKTGLDQVKVQVDQQGDHATVQTVYPSQLGRTPYSVSTFYTVTVPAGTRVTISSVSGNASTKGVKGDLTINLVSGGITIANAGRISEAKTISGSVSITGAESDGTIEAGTISGDLTLDQVKARKIDGSSISSTVTARNVTADTVSLSTISGAVEFDGTLTRNGRYDLTSHSGGVHMTTHGPVGYELTASAFSGQVRFEPAGDLKSTRTSRRETRGTVGDGSAVVNCTTFSGDVVVVRK